MTIQRHCQTGYHSCEQVLELLERISQLKEKLKEQPKFNSRQLAEKVFLSAATAFGESQREVDPLDKEGAIQEIEGILERGAGVPPDEHLKAEREKNEREGRGL